MNLVKKPDNYQTIGIKEFCVKIVAIGKYESHRSVSHRDARHDRPIFF